MKKTFLYAILVACTLLGCSTEKKYKIGVSQCSEDDWRALLNTEIMREARFFGDLDVEILSADDDSRRQTADIERFVSEGKDLIIVAPNVAEEVRPAIEKAFDSGTPVILIDRRTRGEKYTAFVGADNNDIGQMMANLILDVSNGAPERIVELRGLAGSSPEEGRHEGFQSVMKGHAAEIVSAYADWNEPDAKRVMDSLLAVYPKIDYVYAHNDRMALGARKALENAGREKETKIVGIDALLADGGGVDMVLDEKLIASAIYPTGGSEAIQIAHKILEGEEFDRETELPTAIVDREKARVMKLQHSAMSKLDEKYLSLEALTDRQLERINMQKWMLGGAITIVILLVILLLQQKKIRSEVKLADDMLMQNLAQAATMEQMAGVGMVSAKEEEEKVEKKEAEETPEETSDEPAPEEEPEKISETASDPFLATVQDFILANIGNSQLSVNDIAKEFRLSRVQLYRRIKAASDQNATDLIRVARLNKARELLNSPDKSISEVAYSVGFSSPSYFARCYKEHFGHSPSSKQ